MVNTSITYLYKYLRYNPCLIQYSTRHGAEYKCWYNPSWSISRSTMDETCSYNFLPFGLGLLHIFRLCSLVWKDQKICPAPDFDSTNDFILLDFGKVVQKILFSWNQVPKTHNLETTAFHDFWFLDENSVKLTFVVKDFHFHFFFFFALYSWI